MQLLLTARPVPITRRAAAPRHARKASVLVRIRASAIDISDPDGSNIVSGEWPATWSLASYDDLEVWFQNNLLKEDVKKQLKSVMKTKVCSVSVDTPLSADLFTSYSGLPVVDSKGMLIGMISRKDLDKGGSVVGDVMNSKPIAAKPSARVSDAAVLMLKHKVHRIPVVDERARCIGIVTRTDIFQSLEGGL